jgi:chromate transporter
VSAVRPPTFAEASRFWLKLGCISFGGPAGQIALMHAELVEKRQWIGDTRFFHALNYCMLLPGPEAQQLAIYIGWLLHRAPGGLVAGGLFVLPAAFLLWVLSYVYVAFGHVGWIAGAFYGLKPVILAIVASAVHRLAKRALKNWAMRALAALAFVGIFFFHTPFPAIVFGAAAIGWIGARLRPDWFAILDAHPPTAAIAEPEAPVHTRPSFRRAVRILVIGLALWWAPVIAVGACLGWNHVLAREGLFFGKAALITFGGAYAVLPYVAQQAVDHYGWLAAPQMLDGLGLAESTPGPLIMVLQFVGFLGGWNHPGSLPPLVAATLGAAITTWTTFVPCFLWIFLGAPHVEQLRSNVGVNAALAAITAAVVGVILNLAVWFGWQLLFSTQVDWFATILALAAAFALNRLRCNVLAVILTGAAAGVLVATLHLIR